MVTINWPIVLKLTGESELTFVSSAQDWLAAELTPVLGFETDDVVIDSQAQIYAAEQLLTQPQWLAQISHEQMLALLKAHWSSLGVCCVAKTNFDSVADMITAVIADN